MDNLRHDPEYELRWPPDVLAVELDRVIARGRSNGGGASWQDEVETLLSQAFASSLPGQDFTEQCKRISSTFEHDAEEPF